MERALFAVKELMKMHTWRDRFVYPVIFIYLSEGLCDKWVKDDVFWLVDGILAADSTYVHYHIKQKKYSFCILAQGFYCLWGSIKNAWIITVIYRLFPVYESLMLCTVIWQVIRFLCYSVWKTCYFLQQPLASLSSLSQLIYLHVSPNRVAYSSRPMAHTVLWQDAAAKILWNEFAWSTFTCMFFILEDAICKTWPEF